VPLCLFASGAIAPPLYVPNRAKENGEAAANQKGKCKSIGCHF
jgi:hypothetical protein